MRYLTEAEIVGQPISAIWQLEPPIIDEAFLIRTPYVRLGNGVVFELRLHDSRDPDNELLDAVTIPVVWIEFVSVVPSDLSWRGACMQDRALGVPIRDVVLSKLFPGIGLRLESDVLVVQDMWSDRVWGPVVEPIEGIYSAEDLHPVRVVTPGPGVVPPTR